MNKFIPFPRILAQMALAVSFLTASIAAHAQEAPDMLVKRISHEVLEAARNDKKLQNGNTRRVQELVETTILPHVDFERTTAMAANRFWRDATPEQRGRLTAEFRGLLVHTYSGALAQVKDQKLVFKPLRADPADVEVEVRSQVVQPRGEPIPISYRLIHTAAGWKIYDVNILGAWLIETYKGNFAAEVDRGGIDGLIRTLAEKNRRFADNATRAKKTDG